MEIHSITLRFVINHGNLQSPVTLQQKENFQRKAQS